MKKQLQLLIAILLVSPFIKDMSAVHAQGSFGWVKHLPGLTNKMYIPLNWMVQVIYTPSEHFMIR